MQRINGDPDLPTAASVHAPEPDAPDQAFAASLQAEIQSSSGAWKEIAATARGIEAEPVDVDSTRALIGSLSSRFVCSVNRLVCKLTPGRRSGSSGAHICLQSSKLAREWTLARAVIHTAIGALDRDVGGNSFEALVRAAKAWRSALQMHTKRFPEASLGPLANKRIDKPSCGAGRALRSWRLRVRKIIVTHKCAWAPTARRLHRQVLAQKSRANLEARRAAHREGDMSGWLALLAGPKLPAFPAALEAPAASSAVKRVQAGADILYRKYGIRRWDAPRDSPIITGRVDAAGRRRGSLIPIDAVDPSFRHVAGAAWNYGRPPIVFGDPCRPLDDTERRYIWSAFGDSLGPLPVQTARCVSFRPRRPRRRDSIDRGDDPLWSSCQLAEA